MSSTDRIAIGALVISILSFVASALGFFTSAVTTWLSVRPVLDFEIIDAVDAKAVKLVNRTAVTAEVCNKDAQCCCWLCPRMQFMREGDQEVDYSLEKLLVKAFKQRQFGDFRFDMHHHFADNEPILLADKSELTLIAVSVKNLRAQGRDGDARRIMSAFRSILAKVTYQVPYYSCVVPHLCCCPYKLTGNFNWLETYGIVGEPQAR
jgi:hypothetical protein